MNSGLMHPVQAQGAVLLQGGADLIAVPSGLAVTLQDVIWNETGPAGLTMRFRFVAPSVSRDAPDLDFDVLQADLQALCETYAVPRLAELGPKPAQVVISLSSRPVPFGEAAPDVTQFFEAYSVQNGTCQWEMF